MSDPRRAPWLEHLQHPRGAGGWPPNSPGILTGEAGDESEGRLIRLQLHLDPDGRIDEARFRAFGCAATLASASYLTEHLRGLTPATARTLHPDQISLALELPSDRHHAPALALEALHRALATRVV